MTKLAEGAESQNIDDELPSMHGLRIPDTAEPQVHQEIATPMPPSNLTRRRRRVVALACAALLVAGGGLGGAMLVKSPAQVAADAKAPKAGVITAPVASQVLANTVVLRGDFSDGKQVSVTPTSVAATASESGGTNPGGTSMVVTRVLLHQGDSVSAAQPIAEVSGRPIYVLPGAVPTYRDMVPGESGADIAQLQRALRGLGCYSGGDTTGYFGSATKTAVARLYRSMNYPAPITGAQTQQAVQQAKQALDQQEQLVQRLRQGGGGPLPSPASASTASPAASAGGTANPGGSPSPDGHSGMPTGSGASEQQQLPQAQQQLQQDQTAYNQAVAQDGVMVPASEMAFVPSLPARITALPVATGDKVNGAVVSLSTGGLKLTGYLDPSQGSLVKPGMRANITSESLGLSASGTVASVGSLITPGDKHNDGQVSTGSGDQSDQSAGAAVNDGNPYRPLVVTAKAWDKRLDGQNVRITITAAATSAPVLTVPEAAIDSGADTKATVTVVASDGTQHTVQVTAGVSANGDVEVEPVSTGALRAGDRVVIGQ